MSKLTAYHDVYNPIVFQWDERTAMVQLSGWAVTLVPLDGADTDGDVPDQRRTYMNLFLSRPYLEVIAVTIGDLSSWANRRGSEKEPIMIIHGCYECDLDETFERGPDRQKVMSGTFDRRVIRETMQWLYEHRVDPTHTVTMRLVGSPKTPTGPFDDKHPILLMTCGDWTGCVMCCRHDASHGDDPLVPRE